jgi:hypothetical protein
MAVNNNVQIAQAALRQLYAEEIKPFFEQETPGTNKIKDADECEFLPAKGWKRSYLLAPPSGMTRGGETMDFGTPNSFKLGEMFIFPILYAFTGRITGRLLRNLKTKTALVKKLSEIMAFYTRAAAKDKEIGLFNDGSGTRAVVSSTGTKQITCATAGASTAHQTKGAVHVVDGENYNIINGSTGAVRGSIQVKNHTATVINTVAALPGGTTNGDYIVHVNAYRNHESGFAALISNASGVKQLVNTANVNDAKSPTIDLNGAALTVATMTKLKAMIKNRAGGKDPQDSFIALTPGMEELLTRTGHNIIRYGENHGKTLDLTFDAFAVGNTMCLPLPDCDENRAYWVNGRNFRWYPSKPFGPFDDDGNIMRMVMGSSGYGTDVYGFALGWEGNYGVEEFNSLGLINRIAFSDVATQVNSRQ